MTGPPPPRPAPLRPIQLVVIAASTGGPDALARVFANLAHPFPAPIVIVQHMPPVFTKQLADRLAQVSGIPISEAKAPGPLRRGFGFVAPGDYHLLVKRTAAGLEVELDRGPQEHSCRPAADVTFRTAAAAAPGAVLGVVLTGIGRDGCAGARAIVAAGGRVLAQDKASSVVWGMPGAVAAEGLAHRVLPLGDIGPAVLSIVTRSQLGAS